MQKGKNVADKRRARGTGQKGVYGQLGRLTRSYKDTLHVFPSIRLIESEDHYKGV